MFVQGTLRIKPICAVLCLLLASILIAGPGYAQGKGNLVVAISGDVEGWDPATVIFHTAGEVVVNTHDQLTEYELVKTSDGTLVSDTSRLKPMLAESWTVSPDGKTITFRIRKGMKFSNGDPVDAEAIRFNFERFLAVPGDSQFICNVIGIKDPKQVKVVDPYTVRFDLDAPNPLFLKATQLNVLSIVSPRAVKEHATDDDPWAREYLKTHTTGSGPFRIEKWQPGVELVLAANPNYWKGAPKCDRIIFKVVPSETDRLLMLKRGDVDIAFEISAKQITRSLLGTPGVRVVSVPTPGTEYLVMNNKMKPFDNPLVRKAVSYAIPYDLLIEKVLYGYAAPCESPIPEGMPYHRKVKPYNYDLAKAKALLKEAGYPNGFEVPLSLRLGNPVEEELAVYIQAELAKIGVRVHIEKLAPTAFTEKLANHDLVFAFNYWISYVNDPVYHTFWNYHSESPCNYANYKNPEVDKLIEQSQTELDEAKREQIFSRIQDLVIADAPIVYLYQPYRNTCMRDTVNNYAYYFDHMVRYWPVYADK